MQQRNATPSPEPVRAKALPSTGPASTPPAKVRVIPDDVFDRELDGFVAEHGELLAALAK